MTTKIKSASEPIDEVLRIIHHSSFISIERLLTRYSLLFQALNIFTEVVSDLQKSIIGGCIPLQTIETQCEKLEKVINSLASITLQTELKFDVLPVTVEIKEKLNLTESFQTEYLDMRFQKLTSEMYDFYKDKNMLSCLDRLKEKTWSLLESLIAYAEKKYHRSIV